MLETAEIFNTDSLGMDFLLSLTLLVQPLPADVPSLPDRPAETEIASAGLVVLSEAEIRQRLNALPLWTTDGETLFYEQTFVDFEGAIAFVNALVAPAEALGHHPDIVITYNRVALTLTTHDAGGLTELDFQLAEAISQLLVDQPESAIDPHLKE
ncbi:MAG: 4a-hydroxytetrahydrobiopterin dehydratase [Cyanobacteria bacterium P01_D01_bin.115]